MMNGKMRWLAFLGLLMMCFQMACPAPPPADNADRCIEDRRCGAGDEEVCDADGTRYACQSMADCLGVQAQACEGSNNNNNNNTGNSCSDVLCDVDCSNGYKTDDNGCPTCECKEPVDCPAIGCAIFCEDGFKTGEDGCPTCECKEPPECEPVACRLFCENGFKTGEDGCEICECADEEPVCPDIVCPDIDCEFFYRLDERGCQTCECREPACPDRACPAMECPFGQKIDDQGCETCECAEARRCQRNEDCSLEESCEQVSDADIACCPPGEDCPDDIPVCVYACLPKIVCSGDGDDRPCPRGLVCLTEDRRDCCGPNEFCTTNIPVCPGLCLADDSP